MALVVACVGSPMNTPCSPRERTIRSATAKASSVFPDPGGASTIMRSGSASSASLTAAIWASVGVIAGPQPKRWR